MNDRRYRLWMRSLRVLGRVLLSLGYRFEIRGMEHVPREGGVLAVCNHVSFHDWLFVGAALPRPPRFVMHQHHFQYPLLRAFFDASRVIPIAPHKQDPARLAQALEAIDAALANGELVVIFPEGRMTDDGQLSEFRPGLERIVSRRPVPVLPIGISGLFGSFFSRARGEPMSGWPQRVRARVVLGMGEPIAAKDAEVPRVRRAIESLLAERGNEASSRSIAPAAVDSGASCGCAE